MKEFIMAYGSRGIEDHGMKTMTWGQEQRSDGSYFIHSQKTKRQKRKWDLFINPQRLTSLTYFLKKAQPSKYL